MRKFFHVPSPSMIIALIALFVALSGTAVAATSLAKNSVGSKQIRKNAVTSSKIKANSVTGSKVKNGSLTGADINLGSIGTVPSATTAGSAGSVNGVTPTKVNYQSQSGAGATEFFNAGGLKLQGSCTAGQLSVIANPTTDNGMIHVANANLSSQTSPDGNKIFYEEDDNFDTTDNFDALPDGNAAAGTGKDSVQGTLTYAAAGGSVVTITFLAESDVNLLGGSNDCFMIGTASVS